MYAQTDPDIFIIAPGEPEREKPKPKEPEPPRINPIEIQRQENINALRRLALRAHADDMVLKSDYGYLTPQQILDGLEQGRFQISPAAFKLVPRLELLVRLYAKRDELTKQIAALETDDA